VVGQFDDAGLFAVGVEFVNEFGGDFDLAAVELEFAAILAEVEIGVAVLIAQRRGRHAELVGGLEPFENLAPVGFFPGAAPVALVHDHQVEEVAWEFLVEAGAPLVPGDRLVRGCVGFGKTKIGTRWN
jgi:hypothetical protein